MKRFSVCQVGKGRDAPFAVYDSALNGYLDKPRPGSFKTAAMVADRLNSELKKEEQELQRWAAETSGVTKPEFHETVPDCAAKLKATEERAERYRHALAQILRHSDCPTAGRYAAAALFIADRVKGETS